MEGKLLNDLNKPKSRTAVKMLRTCGFVLLLAVLCALTVNSLLSIFMDRYYPTFGKYRLFAVVTDSMSPSIPTGDMIVSVVPESPDEIQVGSVITYELETRGNVMLFTHRVTEILRDAETGKISYVTQGDNAAGADAFRPAFDNVVGVWTGKKCGFFGYLFGFIQSSEGAIALIIILLIIVLTFIVVKFVNCVSAWRRVAVDALHKAGSMLNETHDEKNGTIADVIGIVAKDPTDTLDLKRKDKKLGWFIRTGALPKRPYRDDLDETSAMIELGGNAGGVAHESAKAEQAAAIAAAASMA